MFFDTVEPVVDIFHLYFIITVAWISQWTSRRNDGMPLETCFDRWLGRPCTVQFLQIIFKFFFFSICVIIEQMCPLKLPWLLQQE